MHGIDFLKSCDTNVRVLQDVAQTSLAIFDLQLSGNDLDTLQTALATLREHQILCCVIDRQIWTFGQPDHDVTHLLDARFRQRPGPPSTISQHEQSDITNTPSAMEAYLNAVEGAISFYLAKQLRMIRICAWRWILPSLDGGEGSSTVLRMHAKLADPGTLHLFYNVKPCLLHPVRKLRQPVPVVLGCCGLLAKLATKQSVNPGQDEMHSDRHFIAGFLATIGVAADADEPWVPVEVSIHGEVMLTSWPARLCFTGAFEPTAPPALEDGDRWKQWFSSPGREDVAFETPLSIAEQWFFRASAGDFKSDSPLNPTGTLHGETVDIVAIAETPITTSSPFNQRTADLQAAMAGIYPTPPDGLLPGTTPSQHISQLSDAIPEGEVVDFTASMDSQPESSEAFVQPARLSPYHSTNEDLFGELGEMEMGGNEVGDADFDYFDEPDDVAVVDGPPQQHYITIESPLMDMDARNEPTNVATMSPMKTHSPAGPVPGGDAHSHDETRTDGTLERDDMSATIQSPQLLPATGPKPLSPFGIRERILPPPIPASAQQQLKADPRRSSSYGPLVFNETFSCNRHDIEPVTEDQSGNAHHERSDIGLPRKKHKRLRLARKDSDSGVDGLGELEISDTDFNQDTSSTSAVDDDERRPPKLPWDNRERKRKSVNDHSVARSISPADDALSRLIEVDMTDVDTDREQLHNGLLLLAVTEQTLDSRSFDTFLEIHTQRGRSASRAESLSPVESIYSLSNEDIVAVAQVIAEQATAASVTLTSADQSSRASDPASVETIRISLESALSHMLPAVEECDLAKMAYISDNPAKASANRAPSTPHPRPSVREGTLQAPSMFPLPTPHVHVQRGADNFDVLPTALPFWNALSLAPANGPKNAKVICMVPDLDPLIALAASFMDDVAKVYEGRKLGVITPMELSAVSAERGVVKIKTADDGSPDLPGVLKAYATASVKLGKALAKARDPELDQTIVICMFSPFETDESLKPYLCACYWLLHKAYHSGSHAPLDGTDQSDLLLQIVPLSTIACLQDMGIPNGEHLIHLATAIYDRCPASGKDVDKAVSQSKHSMTGAPAIELATIPPKRIGFQLTPDPPSDILFDGSILHIAYASSRNGRWVTACWMDNTSHYQRIYSASLRGRSFREVATHLWEETCAIIAAKEVTWRIYIATTGEIDSSIAACWRKVVTAKPRKQMLHATLVSVADDDLVQLTPASTPDMSKSGVKVTTPGDGFSTPASTPQTSACIASPDPGGQTNAPPTPMPRDPANNISENDPDVQLVDVADEHWGMLLAPSFKPSRSMTASDPAVSGLLIRRGDDAEVPLETLSLNLHWDIRLRPNGLIDDGPPRQVEANLRETLKTYRSLSLMTRARGRPGLMPLHISSALAAAQDLELF